MSRILLTGARGFIGRHCLPELEARGFEVHALTRSADAPGRASSAVWHRGDLLAPGEAEALIERIRPTHLLHLAWITTPSLYWEAPENLRWADATRRLLGAFVRAGGRRAVAAGSCAEYDWTAGRCNEWSTPLRAGSAYAVAKDAVRRHLAALEPELSAAWARIFWVYGPHEEPRRLVPSIIRSLLRGEVAECSSGAHRRDFLHVGDVAEALVGLVMSEIRGAVNVGSGEAVAVREVALKIGAALGAVDRIRFGAAACKEAPLVVADTTRLRCEVGFRPRVDLDRGLRSAIEWWRSEGTRAR
jgi:nucleoside-diphosphate-sugar epimerase